MAQLRVGIVSQSVIADDPRVRRQGDALAKAGWDVVALGMDGATSAAPDWRVVPSSVAHGMPDATMPDTGYATRGVRALAIRALARAGQLKLLSLSPYEQSLVSVRIDPKRAETVYWTMNSIFWHFLALGRREKVDLWLGNDWTSLPVVARLSREAGIPYAYDTHELCAEEFYEDKRWRFVQKPVRVLTEGAFIRDAGVVSTVSPKIAERLAAIHSLDRTPLSIRSTPTYQEHPFRPTGERIRVLYHGAVWQHRGLEACIRSVAAWRSEFDLTIRGPISDAYRAELEQEIERSGVVGRVTLAPAVPMTELVREASRFDVGIFALPGHSNHNRYALPNKFFEYAMAGLALCVSDLPEMASLVNRYRLGTLIRGASSTEIAAAINCLDRETIDKAKQNALLAARELCWEEESRKMVSAYEALARDGVARMPARDGAALVG
ncbi:glycosyltransferase [Aureimonas leprariae]|uniref:Glycosyltransferase family 4 protein n=1 Tax=Plantimonas leprariae TaxID=2615207 RepID=A0A7V7PK16_9HYPH|nr:glycosyltransferase [Aureimonas leprariae]KAB0675910.1 glycosyltransferase family 4 protein [Aureimonas leprariae]